MAYRNTKVYFDGSHYIAIPYKTNPTAKKSRGIKNRDFDENKEAFEKAYKGIKGKSKKRTQVFYGQWC